MLQKKMKKTFYLLMSIFLASACASDDSSNITLGPGEGVVGVGGSTARFTINGDRLYVVTNEKLKTLGLENPGKPELIHSNGTFGELETIFSYGENLFLGARNGIYVYSLANRDQPEYITRYSQQSACNPIFAKGDFAYITVRADQSCRNQLVNQLITIDISDISRPIHLDTVEMLRPRGLTIYNDQLYVGEGALGLKRFDLTIPYRPRLDTFYTSIAANDLIAVSGGQLIITANQGVSQYLQQNEEDLSLISTID